MKLDTRVALSQNGPFAACLLHAFFAEDALACVDRLINRVSRNGLGHGDEPHGGGIAISSLCGERELQPAGGGALLGAGARALSCGTRRSRAATSPGPWCSSSMSGYLSGFGPSVT